MKQYRMPALACALALAVLAGCGAGAAGGTASAAGSAASVSASAEVPAATPLPRMLYAGGALYADTGQIITGARCGVLDGSIETVLAPEQVPAADGEANFEGAAGYQVVPGGLDVPIDGRWVRFAPAE